ncbi:MAG: restriction endonuclease [Nitrospirae bacterium]|nr:restriction endonuclease [Nitrospirota bacterium]
MTSQWRQFEQLVTLIERAAGPKNAIVKSPDRIRDLVTGRLREVDASIRYKVGTVDVLITFECRKRSRKSDDMWVEQLAMKRQKIGAARTIAVSATGFSESAYRTAQMHGIELRTLSEVDPSTIDSWFVPTGGIAFGMRAGANIECVVFLKCQDGSAHEHGIVPPSSCAPVFESQYIQSPFSANVLFSLVAHSAPESLQILPHDGSFNKVGFQLNCDIPIYVRGDKGLFPVHHFNIFAAVGLIDKSHLRESGKHHIYELSDHAQIQHSRFVSDIFGAPVQIDMLQDHHGNDTTSINLIRNKAK